MGVQWLRICLPMQGTRVRSLVGELKPHMPQGNQAHVPQLHSPRTSTREKPARHNERSRVPQLRPDTAINK